MSELDRSNLLLLIERKLSEIELSLYNYPYEKYKNFGFFSGTGGLALYNYLKFKQTGHQYFLSKSLDIFDYGLKRLLENETIYTGFIEGISGYLWFYNRYSIYEYYEIPISILKKVKSILKQQFKLNIAINDWDYMYGNIGICLNDIGENPLFEFNLSKKLFQFLSDKKQLNDQGYWFSKQYPEWINFSLAHGIPSVLMFIKYCHTSNIEKLETKELLKLSTAYILSKANKQQNYYSIFPSYIMENGDAPPSRLAWCYGDISIAHCLFEISNLLNDKKLRENSLEIALKTCERKSVKTTLIDSPTFCHGSIGLGYIYFKLYKGTGIDEFKEAMEHWLKVTMRFSIFEDGIAGFKDFDRHNKVWTNNIGILEGVIGIYLSLATITGKFNSEWDRCLLLS